MPEGDVGLTVRELRKLPFAASVRWRDRHHDFIATKIDVDEDRWQGPFAMVQSEQLAGADLIAMPLTDDAEVA